MEDQLVGSSFDWNSSFLSAMSSVPTSPRPLAVNISFQAMLLTSPRLPLLADMSRGRRPRILSKSLL